MLEIFSDRKWPGKTLTKTAKIQLLRSHCRGAGICNSSLKWFCFNPAWFFGLPTTDPELFVLREKLQFNRRVFFSCKVSFCYSIKSLQVEFCAERKLLRNSTPFRADLKRSDYLIPTLYVLRDKQIKVPGSTS